MIQMKDMERYKSDIEHDMNKIPLDVLDLEWMKEMGNVLDEYTATDYVETSYETLSKIRHLWTEEDVWNIYGNVPSDIIISNTIPIRDIEISLIGGVPALSSDRSGNLGFRVVINDKEYWEEHPLEEGNVIYVGGLFLYLGTSTIGRERIIFTPITYYPEDANTEESDKALIPKLFEVGFIGDWSDKAKSVFLDNVSSGRFIWIVSCLLECWYSTQISLLHPQFQEVFSKVSGKEKRKVKDPKTGMRKTCYVRRHYIGQSSLDKVIKSHESCYHCPAWYVIGHYRHYKNGKTGWVNGYWKGALRETKKSFDEGRQRILETSHLEGEKSL